MYVINYLVQLYFSCLPCMLVPELKLFSWLFVTAKTTIIPLMLLEPVSVSLNSSTWLFVRRCLTSLFVLRPFACRGFKVSLSFFIITM